jgi:hypothetical protein
LDLVHVQKSSNTIWPERRVKTALVLVALLPIVEGITGCHGLIVGRQEGEIEPSVAGKVFGHILVEIA